MSISRLEKSADSQMINAFGFYEYEGKDYVVAAPFAGHVKANDVDSLTLVQEIPITSIVAISVSPSNRFMVVGGVENAISVYELLPEGNQCKFQLRKTLGVLGTCYTAHWTPDETCFAVSSDNGFAYLFSFKVTPNNDLDVQFVASYEVNQNFTKRNDDDELRAYVGLENVKFHPRPDKKIFAYSGAYVGHVYLVDYSTLQIVQTFAMTQEKGKLFQNFGVEFSPDGNNLYFTFTEVGGDKPISQLVSLQLEGVSTLTNLSLNHIHKNKDNWQPTELQQNTLPESLLEKLSLVSKQ